MTRGAVAHRHLLVRVGIAAALLAVSAPAFAATSAPTTHTPSPRTIDARNDASPVRTQLIGDRAAAAIRSAAATVGTRASHAGITDTAAALRVAAAEHPAESLVPFLGVAEVGCTTGSGGRICAGHHSYEAIDFLMPDGTPVVSPVRGVIREVAAGCGGGGACHAGYGNFVRIAGDDGLDYVLAHLSTVEVTAGRVRAGQVVGRSGHSGQATTPHLHYEEKSPATGGGGDRRRIGPMASVGPDGATVTYPTVFGAADWHAVPAHADRFVTGRAAPHTR